LFYIWSTFIALSMTPLLLGKRRWVVATLGVWARGINLLLRVVCGIKVELRGREHMPTGPAIVAPKHQCMYDVFAQFAWLPYACFVMKQELARIPFFGWYAIKAGMVRVDRAGHAAALKKLVKDAKDRFRDDRQLIIFPEGTRGEPGQTGDYKPGIAALYRELDLWVHPVATNSGVCWPAHGFKRYPGTIVFEYLEPIPPGLKRAEFMRTLQERIEAASLRLLDA
jgi:1-acyl-sn-glycerol-3-phosphate acyltransferase